MSITIGDPLIINNGLRLSVATIITTSSTLAETYYVVPVDATSGAVTITLPAAPSDGRSYFIHKKDSSNNGVTVSGNGNNINGASTSDLIANQYDSLTIYYNNADSEWYVI